MWVYSGGHCALTTCIFKLLNSKIRQIQIYIPRLFLQALVRDGPLLSKKDPQYVAMREAIARWFYGAGIAPYAANHQAFDQMIATLTGGRLPTITSR